MIHDFQVIQGQRKHGGYKAKGAYGSEFVSNGKHPNKKRKLNLAELSEMVLPVPPSVNPASPPRSPFSPPPELSLTPATLGQQVHASYVRLRYQDRKEYLRAMKEAEEAGLELDPETIQYADMLEDRREIEKVGQEDEMWKGEKVRAQKVRERMKRDVESAGWAPIRACYGVREGGCISRKGVIDHDEAIVTAVKEGEEVGDSQKGKKEKEEKEEKDVLVEIEGESNPDIINDSGKKRKFNEIADGVSTVG
jgi:hypothetical protein